MNVIGRHPHRSSVTGEGRPVGATADPSGQGGFDHRTDLVEPAGFTDYSVAFTTGLVACDGASSNEQERGSRQTSRRATVDLGGERRLRRAIIAGAE